MAIQTKDVFEKGRTRTVVSLMAPRTVKTKRKLREKEDLYRTNSLPTLPELSDKVNAQEDRLEELEMFAAGRKVCCGNAAFSKSERALELSERSVGRHLSLTKGLVALALLTLGFVTHTVILLNQFASSQRVLEMQINRNQHKLDQIEQRIRINQVRQDSEHRMLSVQLSEEVDRLCR